MRIRKIVDSISSEIELGNGLRKSIALANYNVAELDRDRNFYKNFQILKIKKLTCGALFLISHHNSQTLYHNAIISHFVQDYDSTCQQCERGNLKPAPKENISHMP